MVYGKYAIKGWDKMEEIPSFFLKKCDSPFVTNTFIIKIVTIKLKKGRCMYGYKQNWEIYSGES